MIFNKIGHGKFAGALVETLKSQHASTAVPKTLTVLSKLLLAL